MIPRVSDELLFEHFYGLRRRKLLMDARESRHKREVPLTLVALVHVQSYLSMAPCSLATFTM